MDLQAAAQGVVDELLAGGVRATLDGRDLNPPAVQVRAPIVHYRFGGGGTADWQAYAVVGEAGQGPSLRAMSVLLAQVQNALGGRVVQAEPRDYLLADGTTAAAYLLTWSSKIPA